AEYAGARKPVHIIEEPMAAAIGSDMPVHEPSGNMIVDIGGGTTEVAVISLGGIVTAQSVRVAGDELDDAIMQYVKKEFSLAIGDRTAEEIKIHMGSAWPLDEELTADIRGRDLISGLPRTVPPTTEQVREALAEPLSAIVDAVKTTLDKTPPELAADIMEQGIMVTGGGALLAGINRRLAHETGMPIKVAHDPLYSVVIGSGRALENIDAMRGLMSLGGDDQTSQIVHAGLVVPPTRRCAAHFDVAAVDHARSSRQQRVHRQGTTGVRRRHATVRCGRRRGVEADRQRMVRHHSLRRSEGRERGPQRPSGESEGCRG